jgi:hypothetical protein
LLTAMHQQPLMSNKVTIAMSGLALCHGRVSSMLDGKL